MRIAGFLGDTTCMLLRGTLPQAPYMAIHSMSKGQSATKAYAFARNSIAVHEQEFRITRRTCKTALQFQQQESHVANHKLQTRKHSRMLTARVGSTTSTSTPIASPSSLPLPAAGIADSPG